MADTDYHSRIIPHCHILKIVQLLEKSTIGSILDLGAHSLLVSGILITSQPKNQEYPALHMRFSDSIRQESGTLDQVVVGNNDPY